MWRFWLVLVFLIPVQAAALSCVPWNIEDSFNKAQSSEDVYVVAKGVLQFSTARLPQVDWNSPQNVPAETRIPARIRDAVVLGRSGDATRAFDLTMIVRCAGPWCPRVESDVEYLVFLRRDGQTYSLEFDPCAAMGWRMPDTAMMKRLRVCLTGQPCISPRR